MLARPRLRHALALTPALLLSAGLAASAAARAGDVPALESYDHGELATPRSAAFSGGALVSSQSMTALVTNPANVASERSYDLGAFADIGPQAVRQNYAVGIVDSATNSWGLAVGVLGAYSRLDPVNDGSAVAESDYDLRLAAGYPVSDRLRIGASARYLRLRQDGPGPLPASAVSGGLRDEPIVNGFTAGAGVTVLPVDWLALAGVAENLTNPGNGFLPLQAGGGVALLTPAFVLEADTLVDFTTYTEATARVMGGAEYLLAGSFPLRAGARYDWGPRVASVSAGVGYADRAVSLDVSVVQSVSGPVSTLIVAGFTLRLGGAGASGSGEVPGF